MAAATKVAGILLAIVVVITLLTKAGFSIGVANGLPYFSTSFSGAGAR